MRAHVTPFLLSALAVLSALTVGQLEARAELDPSLEGQEECSSSLGQAARVVHADGLRGVREFDFAELSLAYAEVPSIVIEGDAALIAGVAVEVEGGVATLRRGRCSSIAGDIRVTVYAPSFDEIGVIGETRVESRGAIRSTGDLAIELAGASSSKLRIAAARELIVFADGAGSHALSIDVGSLIAMHTGSGEVSLSGRAFGASLGELGSGTLATKWLTASRLVIDIDGSGTVTALR